MIPRYSTNLLQEWEVKPSRTADFRVGALPPEAGNFGDFENFVVRLFCHGECDRLYPNLSESTEE